MTTICELCGEPMPAGEEMFKYHGFSGPCPTKSQHPKTAIASELYAAFERLEAPPDLLSIIGSYGDTLSDEEILKLLRGYNETGKAIRGVQ